MSGLTKDHRRELKLVPPVPVEARSIGAGIADKSQKKSVKAQKLKISKVIELKNCEKVVL